MKEQDNNNWLKLRDEECWKINTPKIELNLVV